MGLKLSDYHVTESGFAADMGFEKFWNVKCRYSGLQPHVGVLTTTVRALKMHGGGPPVTPGRPLPLERGLANLLHHIAIIRKSGLNPVVCINRFESDSRQELALVRDAAEATGARCATSDHFARGGEGALELADAVIDACHDEVKFEYLYPLSMKLRDRVDLIARQIYGADGVAWAPEAEAKARTGWTLPIRDVLVYSGARFLCPCAGSISLMPGTSSNPGFRRIDVDTDSGRVTGLF